MRPEVDDLLHSVQHNRPADVRVMGKRRYRKRETDIYHSHDLRVNNSHAALEDLG